MSQCSQDLGRKLVEEILTFAKHATRSAQVTAAYVQGGCHTDELQDRTVLEAVVVVRRFPPRLMNYVRVFDGKTIVALIVDQWVFERDIDRGFLGEAIVWGLVIPYLPLVNEKYLFLQEVKLKKRLTLELLENLVFDFPELSREFCIDSDYFMYEAVASRMRLFPPLIHDATVFMQKGGRSQEAKRVRTGYLEALEQLASEDAVSISGRYIRIAEDFAASRKSPRIRLRNLSKNVPRTLFTSALSIFPTVLDILSKNRDLSIKSIKASFVDKWIPLHLELPKKYIYISTAKGLASLADRTDIETFAKKVISADENAKTKVKALGGFLNDVYLVTMHAENVDQKVVVKQFKDWSSVKWFPLVIWSVGTKVFAVSGRSRLERECAINRFLDGKGFAVPKLLHVSPEERLVFMEYIEGESLDKTIRRMINSPEISRMHKELRVIHRVGKRFARIHALEIALGDTKPDNITIDKRGEIYLMDFEQASRNGDAAWDVAEFLYYSGHYLPALAETRVAEIITENFIAGYLEGGGKSEIIRKVASPKYTKVFSIFTLPLVILAISNTCKRVDALGGKHGKT